MISKDGDDCFQRCFSIICGFSVLVFDILATLGYFVFFGKLKRNKTNIVIVVASFYAVFHCLSILIPSIDLYFVQKTALCEAFGVIQVVAMVHIMIIEPFMGVLMTILLYDKFRDCLCPHRQRRAITLLWLASCFLFQIVFEAVAIGVSVGLGTMEVHGKKCWNGPGKTDMDAYTVELFMYRIVEFVCVVISTILNLMTFVKVRKIKKEYVKVDNFGTNVMDSGMDSAVLQGDMNGDKNELLERGFIKDSVETTQKKIPLTSEESTLLKHFNISAFLALGLIVFNNIYTLCQPDGTESQEDTESLDIFYGILDGLFMVFRSCVVLVYSQRFIVMFYS